MSIDPADALRRLDAVKVFAGTQRHRPSCRLPGRCQCGLEELRHLLYGPVGEPYIEPTRQSLLDFYMSQPWTITLIPDPDEGGFVVKVEDLPGCISQGDTEAEARERIKEAMRGWLEVALDHGDPIPLPPKKQSPSP